MAYKHVIRAKTKNLFDISKAAVKQLNDYFYPKQGSNSNFYTLAVTPGKQYTVSYETQSVHAEGLGSRLNLSVQTGTYYKDGTNLKKVLNNSVEWHAITFTITIPDDAESITFTGLGAESYYRNFMVQEGSTPTPYTPYNYLQSNKRMIKVSNVCQLYAKNIWKEYDNMYGVSIKNNNDGSITLNGTPTATFYYVNSLDYEIKPNHKYLYFDGYPQTPSWDTYVGGCEGKVNHRGMVQFAIYSLNIDGTIMQASPNLPSNTLLNTFCLCYKGFTFNNITIKPQLFDLTEMYGAGNEPTTVAEFKQKFPNDYYPYSPKCWLTSYQSAVVCKTKNLFDVNNAAPYTFTNDNPPSSRISLKDGIYTTTFNNFNVGSGLRIKDGLVLSPGIYTLSLRVITVGETTPITGLTYGFRLYKSDGTKPVITTYTEAFSSRCSHAFTIPADCTDIRLYLAPHCNSGQGYVYISLKDIQVEQGSTATSYVPYQHL